MRFFNRSILLSHPNGDRTDFIPPCGKYTFEFDVPERNFPLTQSFRLIGEPDYFWKWRCEAGSPYSISMVIDDALCTKERYKESYSLKFECHNEPYERNAWTKLFRKDLSPGKEYTFSFAGKAENLQFSEDGSVCVELEIYYAKDGRHVDDVFDAPDEIKRLELPAGSYDWQEITQQFTLSKEAVCIIVHIGLKGVSGTCYLSSPKLCPQCGDTIIPPFDHQQGREAAYVYVAENISRREWLEMECKVDGKVVFNGEKYTSIVRRPDYEISLGSLTPGRHTFEMQLLNNYESAVGFTLQQLELLEYGAHSFELIAAPEFVRENSPCSLLLRTNQDDVSLMVAGKKFQLNYAGLHAIQVDAGTQTTVELKSIDHEDSFKFTYVPSDGETIYLSTSDTIFVHQTLENMERFLEWYFSNNVGNAISFRHSYRWGGGRFMNRPMWEQIITLLQNMGEHYCLIVDGRELPGRNTNPPDSLLSSTYYMGRQAHENDGSFYYWGNSLWKNEALPQPYADLISRGIDKGGIQPHVRPKRNGSQAWWFFDPTNANDMKEASEAFVNNLADAKGESTRHSGPSTLFRYFFQAGYKFLLAEQMYGPEEVILASLRGASKAYGVQGFGSHLAAQWSSTPHDTPEHAERYFLSLATCYLQGVTHINLEEGLYRMERDYVDFDRFSPACQMHQKAHTRFRRFMESHPRRGKLVTPIACIQGRYDGWCCFSRQNIWKRQGDQWSFGDAEKSFDLLNLFYPRSKFDAIYSCPCPVEPQGWYTGTPYGPIDLLPFEGDWSGYKVVIFLGWHTFLPEDGEKMVDFVSNGGTLLLTKRHFSQSLKHDNLPLFCENASLNKLLGHDWQKQNSGIIRRRIGSGEVICFMDELYPANPQIRSDYEIVMKELAEKVSIEESMKGWISGNEDVNFAVYEDENQKRTAYLLNIRWWDKQPSQVSSIFGNEQKEILVEEGEILPINL